MKTDKYIEHLKKKGYKQISDTLFQTSDGYIFQYVKKTEIFYGKERESKYLIMIGKDGKVDNDWCNKDCQYLCNRQDDIDDELSGYCMLRNMNRYIGYTSDINSKECHCVANGMLLDIK